MVREGREAKQKGGLGTLCADRVVAMFGHVAFGVSADFWDCCRV